MGYNNNNAGMHFMRRNRYADYDNLSYYDRKFEEEQLLRIKKMLTDEADKTTVIEEERKVPASPHKKKRKSLNANLPLIKDVLSYYGIPKNGSTEVIDNHFYFDVESVVTSNILITAMKSKKDIYSIMKECDELISNDDRIYIDGFDNYVHSAISKQKTVLTYFALLADRIGCDWREFFENDIAKKQKFIYELLSYLISSNIILNYDRDDDWFICEDFDYLYGMTETRNARVDNSLCLCVWRDFDHNGTAHYGIGFGKILCNNSTCFHSPSYFTELYSEIEGKLKSYVDDLIDLNRIFEKLEKTLQI
ncbi:hypothetical protein [[Clostridium] aminophilum]|uniref:hypothetical protein n=1 Tax=[Clostridium] aminophilum TaxID=1526 RepID=UPI00332F7691